MPATPRSPLEAALIRHGISIIALATQLRIQYSSVWRVVAGKSLMTRPRAERYARALRDLGVNALWSDIL